MTELSDWKAVQRSEGVWSVIGRDEYGDRHSIVNGLDEESARLIAAAPQLLEALEKIAANHQVPLDKVDGESLDATAAKKLYTAWSNAIDIAREAITLSQAKPDEGGE